MKEQIMNKYIVLGMLVFSVASQAMDRPNRAGRPMPKTSNWAFHTQAIHKADMLRCEKKELAARSFQRENDLTTGTPFYYKHMLDKNIKRESFSEVLMVLTHKPALYNGDPLARNLLNVYNGTIDSFDFDPAQYPYISSESVTNTAVWFAEKGGNRRFLENYRDHLNPEYEIKSPRVTFSSSSSGSWSGSED